MPQFTEMRRPALWGDPARIRSRTVVLGYDGSAASRSAALRAAEAAGTGGRVLVVTSVSSGDAFGLETETAGQAEQLLAEARTLLPHQGIEVETLVQEGDPAETLAVAARDNDADLIVVGARGRSYFARALRGSVAARLLTRAPCDVLIAR